MPSKPFSGSSFACNQSKKSFRTSDYNHSIWDEHLPTACARVESLRINGYWEEAVRYENFKPNISIFLQIEIISQHPHVYLSKNLFSHFRLAVAIVRSMKNKQLNAYNEWNSKKPKPIESKVLDPSHEVINKIFKLSMHDCQLINYTDIS